MRTAMASTALSDELFADADDDGLETDQIRSQIDAKYIDRQRIGVLQLPRRLFEPVEKLVGMRGAVSSAVDRSSADAHMIKTIGDWELEWGGSGVVVDGIRETSQRSTTKATALAAQRLSQKLRDLSSSKELPRSSAVADAESDLTTAPNVSVHLKPKSVYHI